MDATMPYLLLSHAIESDVTQTLKKFALIVILEAYLTALSFRQNGVKRPRYSLTDPSETSRNSLGLRRISLGLRWVLIDKQSEHLRIGST